MLSIVRKLTIVGVTTLCLGGTLALTVGIETKAAPVAVRDTYSAGNKEGNGDICGCPVMVGNCVCHVKGVDPVPEAQ
jgi:hypothetical protein